MTPKTLAILVAIPLVVAAAGATAYYGYCVGRSDTPEHRSEREVDREQRGRLVAKAIIEVFRDREVWSIDYENVSVSRHDDGTRLVRLSFLPAVPGGYCMVVFDENERFVEIIPGR